MKNNSSEYFWLCLVRAPAGASSPPCLLCPSAPSASFVQPPRGPQVFYLAKRAGPIQPPQVRWRLLCRADCLGARSPFAPAPLFGAPEC